MDNGKIDNLIKDKLVTEYRDGLLATGDYLKRRYTYATNEKTKRLIIAKKYATDVVTSEKNQTVALFKNENDKLKLIIHCFVDGGSLPMAASKYRKETLQNIANEMIRAIFYADKILINSSQALQDAEVLVCYRSKYDYLNKCERVGIIKILIGNFPDLSQSAN